jgi:hypothetical protein
MLCVFKSQQLTRQSSRTKKSWLPFVPHYFSQPFLASYWGVRGSMKFVISIVFLLTLLACNKREPDPVFDWGNLPDLANDFAIQSKSCAHKSYSLGYFSTSEVQSTLHVKGERISGRSHSAILGDTCLHATISARVYMSPELQGKNYYSLRVGVPTADDRCIGDKLPAACKDSSVAYTTIFQRDISSESIKEFFKGKNINDIIQYNPSNKSLIFNLRDEAIEFQIPNL